MERARSKALHKLSRRKKEREAKASAAVRDKDKGGLFSGRLLEGSVDSTPLGEGSYSGSATVPSQLNSLLSRPLAGDASDAGLAAAIEVRVSNLWTCALTTPRNSRYQPCPWLFQLSVSVQAIESLNKLDVAEIRSLVNPPVPVEVVMEAVSCLLVGYPLSFTESKKQLSGGESFLNRLKDFRIEDVTDARLKAVEPYADNPLFRPENVAPVSYCASKFCAWVLGVVQVHSCV